MTTEHKRRLAKLEAVKARDLGVAQVTRTFIWPGPIDVADFEGQRLLRGQGEAQQSFRDRVMAVWASARLESLSGLVVGPTFGEAGWLPKACYLPGSPRRAYG